MKENQIRRDVEQALNEELGIYSKKDLPFQQHAEYDAVLEEAVKKALHPNQQKLDVHEPEKDELTATDFKLLRSRGGSKEKKPKEYGVETERKKASKGQEMYESNSDTYKAQNLYDKAHSQATKSGKSEKEAHAYASAEMKKKYPNHTASSSGEGQVYKTSMKEEQLDEISWQLAAKAAKIAGNKAGGAEDRGQYVQQKAYQDQSGRLWAKSTEKRNAENRKKDIAGLSSGKKAKYEKNYGKLKEESEESDFAVSLQEKAPPGAKFERMVKHIKDKYKEGGLTKNEKSIAYATAWKAKKKELDEGTMTGIRTKKNKNDSDERDVYYRPSKNKPERRIGSIGRNYSDHPEMGTMSQKGTKKDFISQLRGDEAAYLRDKRASAKKKNNMKEATDIDSIMEEIAYNLNEKAYAMLQAPFHEAAAWFNSLNEEQLSLLDEKIMSQSGANAPAQISAGVKPDTNSSFMNALKGVATGGGTGTPAAQNAGPTSRAVGGASLKRPEETDRTPVLARAPAPAPTPAPKPASPSSEVAASRAANVPDSRTLRAPVKTPAGEGKVGQGLAATGVSRQDRRDQAFVDKTLGAGKYKAGSAQANMALLAKSRADRAAVLSTEKPTRVNPATKLTTGGSVRE